MRDGNKDGLRLKDGQASEVSGKRELVEKNIGNFSGPRLKDTQQGHQRPPSDPCKKPNNVNPSPNFLTSS